MQSDRHPDGGQVSKLRRACCEMVSGAVALGNRTSSLIYLKSTDLRMRLSSYAVLVALACPCGAASAALTCEQLANIAYTTQQLRDQGNSLASVMAEADKLEASKQVTAMELQQIKAVVEESFKSTRSPTEVL